MFGLDSIWHWALLLVLVLLLFGTGKLRNAGRDLGTAIAGFRKGMKDGHDGDASATAIGEQADSPRR